MQGHRFNGFVLLPPSKNSRFFAGLLGCIGRAPFGNDGTMRL
ncbi:hypothetical protein B4113_2981 [Geobacillus sp. B4113_201601]|nr:hypothetical protein B4113_2981 [Geobacillus sp. B4113_201601]